MKKMFIALIVVAMTLSVGVASVEAKRMGGESSFGKKSQSMNHQQATPAQNQAAAKAAPPAAAAAAAGGAAKSSAWKGMLGGALLGLGLGALLSSMGLGGAMASMISTILMVGLLGVAGMFIYRMVRRKMDSNNGMKPSFAGSGPLNNIRNENFTPEIASRVAPNQKSTFDSTFDSGLPIHAATAATTGTAFGAVSSSSTGNTAIEVPADFDIAGFVRHSKTNFIRLQAAWDKADTDDIRDFTTPEMFAELKMQLQERGATANKTDVITIEAEFLGLETIGNDYMAGVKFSGMIKDDPSALAEPFNEIWNLTKPITGNGGWTLAGIEQVV
ncbi:Tim44 domain-containing protein [Glaciimonas sp. PAMC28666]|uniref:Tim44 domain-containing protein n=1 Tax=Glaciimonas sp. PAMC28666 TaxID=2807626 RepID=UPI001963D5A2|nr:Tim44-like domain-containing protein [Glaciimonas sp. PAMC28666]QRX84638.1 Tim44 domain-containing protein [Glaciimonas sp. PAMC28666]